MSDPKDDIVTLAILRLEMEQLQEEVRALRKSTKELVDAWNAAGKVVALIKLASTVLAAIGALWLFVKHGFRVQG